MHSASGKWRDRRLQTKQAGEPSGYGRVISTVIDQAVERPAGGVQSSGGGGC